MRIVFIGSVESSRIALEEIVKNVKPVLVCSLDEEASKNVSDYYPIHSIAGEYGVDYIKFSKINDRNIIDKIKASNPDYIFVIGLSQIIPKEIIDSAKKCTIGFHPTPLPKYRGRAALPWMILLNERDLKISLFKIDEGTDTGDIIVQVPYRIEDDDYVQDVYQKVCDAMKSGIGMILEKIEKNEELEYTKQDEREASYLLARREEDGIIDWSKDNVDIHRLVRAAGSPYPGAFSYYYGNKFKIKKAELSNENYIGIPGQIAYVKDGKVAIITGKGMLIATEYEYSGNKKILVGHKLKGGMEQ